MSQPAVDLAVLHAPPTLEELAEYRAFAETRRAQLRAVVSDPLYSLRSMAEASLSAIEDALKHGYDAGDKWVLELRKSAAQGLAKGWGKYDQALKLAPEIGAEIVAIRAAVERDDAERCLCEVRSGQSHEVATEVVWSPKHERVVGLYTCAMCRQANARPVATI